MNPPVARIIVEVDIDEHLSMALNIPATLSFVVEIPPQHEAEGSSPDVADDDVVTYAFIPGEYFHGQLDQGQEDAAAAGTDGHGEGAEEGAFGGGIVGDQLVVPEENLVDSLSLVQPLPPPSSPMSPCIRPVQDERIEDGEEETAGTDGDKGEEAVRGDCAEGGEFDADDGYHQELIAFVENLFNWSVEALSPLPPTPPIGTPLPQEEEDGRRKENVRDGDGRDEEQLFENGDRPEGDDLVSEEYPDFTSGSDLNHPEEVEDDRGTEGYHEDEVEAIRYFSYRRGSDFVSEMYPEYSGGSDRAHAAEVEGDIDHQQEVAGYDRATEVHHEDEDHAFEYGNRPQGDDFVSEEYPDFTSGSDLGHPEEVEDDRSTEGYHDDEVEAFRYFNYHRRRDFVSEEYPDGAGGSVRVHQEHLDVPDEHLLERPVEALTPPPPPLATCTCMFRAMQPMQPRPNGGVYSIPTAGAGFSGRYHSHSRPQQQMHVNVGYEVFEEDDAELNCGIMKGIRSLYAHIASIFRTPIRPTVQSARDIRKQRLFLSGPMYRKLTISLPGIDAVASEALEGLGIYYAYHVYSVYCRFHGSQRLFVAWLMSAAQIGELDALSCYQTLRDYHVVFSRGRIVNLY